MRKTHDILAETKAALPALTASRERKNAALEAIASRLLAEQDAILEANRADVEASRSKYGEVMIDRLTLTPERIAGMAQGVREVAALPDPEGKVLRRVERPNGLVIEKTSVPLGVVAIIYESRPNVTSDAAVLALKSGNAVILRGGKEAFRSNAAIVEAIHHGLEDAGLPAALVGFIEDTDHASADELMRAVGLIDLLIPRGGAGLIRRCTENAKVPCIQTGTGICHIFVDASADQDKALNIIENAKTSRPSVCNAEEVLLVHKDIAEEFLPKLQKRLTEDRAANGLVPVELRLDPRAAVIIPGTPAGERDFDTEFLDYILAVAVVDSTDAAIAHIAQHSTGHSDAILTRDDGNAAKFTALVDSSSVYVNVSTRFTDGGEFGLGCEMGISTQKLHARGPMGLEELNSYKYIIRGDGQIR
ncbi:MAG: glutamate-5-semialdehyde dehydrogenase [Oscillospiraceae bacterium]|nr:glutamate-5-semialdehyde dehydrogenase [Oscillospiraceae bacterium]MBQ6428804.1 glutamate-5-semialdehyde dehydrogenase [Oscillospiraceae bacterium]